MTTEQKRLDKRERIQLAIEQMADRVHDATTWNQRSMVEEVGHVPIETLMDRIMAILAVPIPVKEAITEVERLRQGESSIEADLALMRSWNDFAANEYAEEDHDDPEWKDKIAATERVLNHVAELTAERDEFERELAQSQKRVSVWEDEFSSKNQEAIRLRGELQALRAERDKDCWYYQGDGEDHPESLTCPVVMQAEQFRELMKYASERGPLLAGFSQLHDLLHRVLCAFVPGNDEAARLASELLTRTAHRISKTADFTTSSTTSKPPLRGTWRHSHGQICCGTLRIAKEDFDTCPAKEFKDEIFGWMCETLNAAQTKAGG